MTQSNKTQDLVSSPTKIPEVSFETAMARMRQIGPARKYPGRNDPRELDGLILPKLSPRFTMNLTDGRPVFTLGSCFARNVETELEQHGANVPVAGYAVPKSEWPWPRANGILNEFTPGTMAQRINWAVQGTEFPAETIVEVEPAAFSDLLLAGGQTVTHERALTRRAEVAQLYRWLPQSSTAIITLGHVESWFDHLTQCYLNRLPDPRIAERDPTRFTFRRLGPDAALSLLDPAIGRLGDLGVNVILTVSPVPIGNSFTGMDCVTANEYSKSVLRIVAEELWQAHSHLDYVPIYETVRTAGIVAYDADKVHVSQFIVRRLVRHIVAQYLPDALAAE